MSALFGSPVKKNAANLGPATQLRVQTSIVGNSIPVGWGQFRVACNLLDYQDFKSTAQKTQQGGKGQVFGGGGKGASSTNYTYSAAVVAGICEGPVTSIVQCWNGKTKQSLASLNLTAFLGDYSQTAWSYMTTHHSANAITYRGIAYVAAGPMQLGDTPELPNLNFEVKAAIADGISGLPDADPKQVVVDFLTNGFYGTGFPVGNIASLTNYSTYCKATGMVISPILTNQTPAADFLNLLVQATNSNFRWSGSTLDIVPYGDTDITAHGSTYTAPSAPLYDIVDADFIAGASQSNSPVDMSRSRASDQFNMIRVRYLDRTNDYNQATVDAFDDAAVALYGPRDEGPKDYPFFCDADAAHQSCSLLLGRQQIRNQYTFTVGRRFIQLDPMDIVSISDVNLGLDGQWVRIVEIQENTDGTLTITAEEYLNGTGHAPIYGRQNNTGYVADYNQAPGSVNNPVIFCAPIQLAPTDLETWICVSGVNQSLWGGCDVWLSDDGTTYKNVGRIQGNARMGVLTATLAAGTADPDVSSTASVNLAESSGTLASGSTTDADRFSTLMYVDGEFLAYRDAALTSANHYNLTYLHRGLYGSSNVSHSSGAPLARLDEQVFQLNFSKDRVGQLVHVKFASFNLWGGGLQDLSACTDYTFTIGGPPTIYAPTSFSASGSIKSIKLTWINPANEGIVATEIWRSASSSFGGATHIADAGGYANGWVDENVATGTTYWYWIRYRDLAGNTGPYTPTTGGAGATAAAITIDGTTDVAPGSITAASLAMSLNPVEVVSALPSSGNFEGRTVFLTTDGQLYRYHSGSFTVAVPAVNVTGTLTDSQLASLSSIKLIGDILPSQLSAAFQGAALNSDPSPSDINAWGNPPNYYIGFLGSGGKVGTSSLQVNANSAGYEAASNPIPVDQDKTYRLHAWWQSYAVGPLADGTTYIGIYLFDSAGVQIATSGGAWWYAVNGVAASTSWQELNALFGAGTAQPFPSNAFTMGIAVYLNFGGTQGVQYAQDLRIEEVIGSTLIRDDSISTPKLSANAVTAAKIAANTITATQIAAGTITANEIAANTITAAKIAAGTITATEIASTTIVAGNIAANTITAGQIASATITANEMAANSITSGKIAANAVVAGTLAVGAINAQAIVADDIIYTGHLIDANVTTGKIAANATTIHHDNEFTGPFSPTANTWNNVLTVTYTSTGAPVTINALFWIFNTDTGSHNYQFRVQKDGTTIYPQTAMTAGLTVLNTSWVACPISWVDTPSAGSVTFTVDYNPAASNLQAYNGVLSLDEIIR